MRFRSFLALLAAAALAAGCGTPGDRVLALPLDHPPTEGDWAGAVALRVRAVGGRTTRAAGAAVDADTVHKATASCHHGTKTPPVDLEVRAFYTQRDVFVRLVWSDPTPHRGPGWRWDGRGWRREGPGQDGAALLWGAAAEGFTCVRACHLEDFRMAGPRAFADYRMATPAAWGRLDLWEWKAGWGRPGGEADDLSLGPGGREPDAPGDRFVENRVPEGDGPAEAPDPEPGARAPAFLDRADAPGRMEVKAEGRWRRGRWTVTFRRALRGIDPEDVRLVPGGVYPVGIALLDGVNEDHNAVPDPVFLWLVPRDRVVGDRPAR
ncbi:ethylbenzene dehydrogenase-related protein [Deferrisoma palaeochoriense]